MSEEIYKTCRRCGRTLPIEQFHANNSSPDGHKIYCRECSAEMAKEYAARRLERNAPQTMGEGNVDGPLSTFKPRELIEELRRRGYKGKLTYTHEITL